MANFTKFFRNGKTFSAYCRMRYGQSKKIWADTELWCKQGQWNILFDQDAADAKFAHKEITSRAAQPVDDDEDYDDERGLRQMEAMAAYIHSGCGLDAYYEDQAAGYVD